ncbi:hypothetical protein D3981_004217 [Escherichia coli]|nr:hypothetical protein [Escherichia coli]
MNIFEKILNASLTAAKKSVQVCDVTPTVNQSNQVIGLCFNADVTFDFLFKMSKEYNQAYGEIPFDTYDDMDLEESTNLFLNNLKYTRNRSFFIDHLRFPICINEGQTHQIDSKYSIFGCLYNKQRLVHLNRDQFRGDGCTTVKNMLDSFFGFVSFKLHEWFTESVGLSLAVSNKITSEMPEICLKTFKYHDWNFSCFDVNVMSKSLPAIVIENMIAPDSGQSNVKGARQCIRNAKRYLKGHARTHCLYVNYTTEFGEESSEYSPRLYSDLELVERDSVKTYVKVFFKDCIRTSNTERGWIETDLEHARRYNY